MQYQVSQCVNESLRGSAPRKVDPGKTKSINCVKQSVVSQRAESRNSGRAKASAHRVVQHIKTELNEAKKKSFETETKGKPLSCQPAYSSNTSVECFNQTSPIKEVDQKPSLFLNFLEGQKAPCPPIGDGTRAFYESLYKENNESIIAIKFCIEHGVLIGTQRKEAYKRYCVLKQLGGFKNVGGRKSAILEEADKTLQSLLGNQLSSTSSNKKKKV